MPNVERFRNFEVVFYPESAPEDFIEVIDRMHVPAFLSPLHDSDLKEDGTPKKPHYHLILMFEGKRSLDNVRGLCSFLGTSLVQVVLSIRGASRYLCHLDNPEKHQYSSALIRCFAGADYYDIISSEADKSVALSALMDYCDREGICFYSDLLVCLRQNKERELFRLACFSCSYTINSYLKSKYDRLQAYTKGGNEK